MLPLCLQFIFEQGQLWVAAQPLPQPPSPMQSLNGASVAVLTGAPRTAIFRPLFLPWPGSARQ